MFVMYSAPMMRRRSSALQLSYGMFPTHIVKRGSASGSDICKFRGGSRDNEIVGAKRLSSQQLQRTGSIRLQHSSEHD